MSLRARLLIGLVLLTAAGLTVAGFITYEEQRSFLYRRLDQQVQASVAPMAFRLGVRDLGFSAGRPPGGGRLRSGGSTTPRVPGTGAGTTGPGTPSRSLPRPAFTAGTSQPFGTYGELIGPRGVVLDRQTFRYGEAALPQPVLPARLPLSRVSGRRTVDLRLFTVGSRGSGLRYRVEAVSAGAGRTVVVAVPLAEVDQTLHRLVVVELLVAAGVLAALIALGAIVIRIGLAPLERIGRTATSIAHGDLSQRITPATSRTEVGRLGLSLNDMLAQIEGSFHAQRESEDRLRQFLADASHELRTPLASVRGYVELIRLGAVDDRAELARVVGRMEAETARMGDLIEELLMLARLDELPPSEPEPVELRTLAGQATQDARVIAPDRAITLQAPDAGIVALGAERELRQVLTNLLANAIAHTPHGSPIEVVLRANNGEAQIGVVDHGPGLSPEAAAHVFDRFWRAEEGRSRASGGSGLGLAIVRALVESSRGSVSVAATPGGGATFWITLPAAEGT